MNTDTVALNSASTDVAGPSWRLAWRPLLIFVASRAGVLLVVGATSVTAKQTVMKHLIGWDSRWYLMIAHYGYVSKIPPGSGNPAQSDLGFFPLVPLLIRFTHFVTPFGWNVSGVIAMGIVGAAAAVALWWLLSEQFGLVGGDRGTLLVFVSPAAFVMSMMYSESAIILFVSCSLIALRHRHWALAGLCAAVATTADPVACAAIVPCVVASVIAIRTRREWKSLLAPLIAPLGVGLFFVYLWIHTGSLFEWFRAQRAGWQRGPFGGGVPVALYHFFTAGFHDINPAVKSLSFFFAIFLVIFFLRVRPPAPWTGYVLTVLAFGLISPIIGVTPRLLLRAFPLLGVFGAKLPAFWFELVLATSALILAALTVASGSPHWTP